MILGTFLDGPLVKNPPSNAGNSGSIPGGRAKIPHAMRQLSTYITARESLSDDEDPAQPKIFLNDFKH